MNGIQVFITGGAGFIGSRLSAALSRLGAKCWIFDNLHPQVHGLDAHPPELPPRVEFIRGDVLDGAALAAALRRAEPEVVFHLAAETGTGQSTEEPVRYCDVNVMGAARLIEALRNSRRPPRRLVLASSRAVYGEGAYVTQDGRLISPPARTARAISAGRFQPELEAAGLLRPRPTPEDLPPNPASIYGATKLMQEHLVLQTLPTAPWTAWILRLQNVYGPGQSLRNPYTGVLSIFADQLRRGKQLNVFEDGGIVRDFVYVDDVVDAMVRAATSPGDGGILNIGSGEPVTIFEAAEEMARATGRTLDMRVSGDFRQGDVRFAVADVRRAREQLGWRSSTSFSKGIGSLIQWAAVQEHAI